MHTILTSFIIFTNQKQMLVKIINLNLCQTKASSITISKSHSHFCETSFGKINYFHSWREKNNKLKQMHHKGKTVILYLYLFFPRIKYEDIFSYRQFYSFFFR